MSPLLLRVSRQKICRKDEEEKEEEEESKIKDRISLTKLFYRDEAKRDGRHTNESTNIITAFLFSSYD